MNVFKITLASISSAMLLLACVNASENVSSSEVENAATASGNYDPEAQPAFEWTEVEHNYGTIKDGDVVEHTFTFKNVGKGNLIISDVKASCGCTIPEWSKEPVRPGSGGEIKVKFDSSNKAGGDMEVIKTVTVVANTNPNKVTLKLVGKVK